MQDNQRTAALGKDRPPSVVFRGRFALFTRSFRRAVGSFDNKRIGDFGCGHHASFSRPFLPEVGSAVFVDVTLADELKDDPKVQAIEGLLPDSLEGLPSASLDVILCISALEHLTEPNEMLAQCRRLLAPGGVLIVNVPTWRGKRVLEFLAFRLGMRLDDEINDHKMYYDGKDLWPLLRQAGFSPRDIRCERYPFGLGLTTFAVCRA